VGAVELLLNHCIEGPREYVVVDMTAGADTFASGLFTRFDLTCLVVEPTRQSLGVYRQYIEYARSYDVKLAVIANKIETQDDVTFVREQINEDLLTWIGRSAYVRAAEKGTILPFSSLEASTHEALVTMKQAVDSTPQDWDQFYRQAVLFHRQNALAWMNASQGEDVTAQIDPDFSLGASLAAFSS
jgi:CO dehydrogenase maturation factor